MWWVQADRDPAELKQLRSKPRNEPTTATVSVLATRPYAAVVLDIEGTTTPITFVHDVLFPYAHKHVRSFLEEHYTEPFVQETLRMLREQAEGDAAAGMTVTRLPDLTTAGLREVVDAAVANVHEQMALDRKTTVLKRLQGPIWQEGYARGAFKAVVYADCPLAFQRWKQHGIPIYIYSSGSVAAQQLLFRHTQFGDLTPYISGYFDTTTGPKRAAASYDAIATAIRVPAERVLFASDILEEAQAAVQAGYGDVWRGTCFVSLILIVCRLSLYVRFGHAVLMLRKGNAPLSDGHGLPTSLHFLDLTNF